MPLNWLISQSIGTGYLYPRDLVTRLERPMHLSVKLYATIITLIVDTINDTASVIYNTVNLQWSALILYHVQIDIQYIYILAK
jgi:hypothetical protein